MYDVIIIGGGLGYAAAVVLAKAKLKTALVEKDLNNLGGTCLHSGCIPSKNLLHRAKTLVELQEGFFEEKAKLNLEKLQNHINETVGFYTQAIKNQLIRAGVELIEDEGYVTDDGVYLKNADKTLKSKYIIIADGSYPRIPQGIEYDKKRVITSYEALKFTKPPKEISIYGSGAIGLEMASFFAAIGTKTNLIFRHSGFSKMSPEFSKNLQSQLENIGVNLMPNSEISKAKTARSKVKCILNGKEFETEYLLVATGRIPKTDTVKTDKIKIQKGIVTDEWFETTMPGVYAVGDCNGKLMLAHAARAEALNVANQILGKKEKLNLSNIPKFIYTLPLSYASIGETSQNFSVFELKNLGIARSLYLDTLGLVKLYADSENFIKGAEILSPNAEELIGILSSALANETDVETFKKAVFPHPTYSEGIERALRRFR